MTKVKSTFLIGERGEFEESQLFIPAPGECFDFKEQQFL